MVSPDAICLPAIRSTEPSDTESQGSVEGSVTTDDSVSPIQEIFDISLDSS